MREAHPLEEEPPRRLDAPRVAAPVSQPQGSKLPVELEALGGGEVDVAALLDLGEEPGLDL